MQIKLGTARSMGYRGTAAGLLDADTNMTYAVKYLAGAYHAADGNANRAVHYYAAGYYYAAKSKGRSDKTTTIRSTPSLPRGGTAKSRRTSWHSRQGATTPKRLIFVGVSIAAASTIH